jgi:hypothetical protein
MYWVDSYWGGCIAAAGAALLLTAAGRFLKDSDRTGFWNPSGLLLALGLLLLCFSRPYEGGVLAIGVIGCLLWRRPLSKRWLPLTVTALPLLIVGIGWNLYYNRAVTGSPLQLPYLLYDRTFDAGPTFWFLPLHKEPHYEQPRLALQHGLAGWEVEEYYRAREHLGYHFHHLAGVLKSVLGPLSCFVFLLPFAWLDERCRFLTPIAILSGFASSLVVWTFPHYLAPALTAMLLLCACIADSPALASGRFGRRWWALGLVVLSAGYNILFTARSLVHFHPSNFERVSMINECLKVPGKHLVLIQYQPTISPSIEWVFNGADLDSQRVILAHDLGPAQDKLLEQHYPDRTVWTVTVGPGAPGTVVYTLRRLYSAGALPF